MFVNAIAVELYKANVNKVSIYSLYAYRYMQFFCFIGSKASPLENSQKAKYGYLLPLESILSKGLHLPKKMIKTHGQVNSRSIHNPCHMISPVPRLPE